MISSLHGLYDDRVYWKEACSLRNHGYEVMHVTLGNQDLDFISDEGIRLIQIRKKKYFKNPYLDILFRRLACRPDIYRKILSVCEQLKADVYHFHDLQINRIGERLKHLGHHPRVIYDVHEDYYELAVSNHEHALTAGLVAAYASRYSRMEKSVSRSYDAVIAAVPHIAEQFRRTLAPEKLHVLYNYTTMQPVRFIPYHNKSYDAVYSGLMNKNRGGLEIIKAAALVRETIPDVRILIAGPVPDAKYLKSLRKHIRKLGLEKNVVLKEPVPYRDMEKLLMQCRIGLAIFLPVPVFHFGIQVKTFEYMACGLPVVCSNFGNIRVFISENDAGIPVDPLVPVEIAEAVIRLLNDSELYDRCSRNGIQAVQQKYSWRSEEKKLIGIYHDFFKDNNR
ncbi:MAG: glycosyltransferase family 4 protein [Bacteroidales bacterium]|nr:glycosyltransferase family 4 protein [Bacteroidales bacterium]